MTLLRLCITISFTLRLCIPATQAQEIELPHLTKNNDDKNTFSPPDSTDTILARISYENPRKYTIAGIEVTGVPGYDDFVLIGFSGLAVGDVVSIPGEEITTAVKRFWRHGLFSDVKIAATRIEDGKVWLQIRLQPRPRISAITYTGVKKNEREELETRLGLRSGQQITPTLVHRAQILIERYFHAKGFKNVAVEIIQQDDLSAEGNVLVSVNIDKKLKTKVHQIHFQGNTYLSDRELKKVMKKTNEKFSLRRDARTSLRELFSTKKFTTGTYETDKQLLISRYNELGYRDAVLLSDSVVNRNEKTVEIFLSLEEGQKYHLRSISFIGNSQYPTEQLEYLLNMKAGEVYNQKKLNDRLLNDEDAVANLYYNNGYLFFNADPVEIETDNDSISLEIRIQEGRQATINRIIINGNDRVYEDVVRRELRTRPGELFNRNELVRSIRELAQMGHFDPESMSPQPLPDPESGTVDIQYNLTSKANDQIEFAAGWGANGLTGKLSLKFTNFSLNNFLRPSTYKGIIPQGDGQTLTVSAQTDGRYYQSYGFSFVDPWFGKKRPDALSFSASYSKMTRVNKHFYNQNLFNNLYPGTGGVDYDPNKYMKNFSISLGYGKRLKWPDDYFQFMASLNYQFYKMKDWDYYRDFPANGTSHNINMEFVLQRNSIDNPVYTRRGSQFSLSLSLTPPYSLLDGKDYASMAANDPAKMKFIEYHKWKFKAKTFSPLAPLTSRYTPVLMTRVEYGILGSYNKHKRSSFENFYVGGDASSGGTFGVEMVPMRGYTAYAANAFAYTRLGMELRFPVLLQPSSTIYLLGFIEGGNAWEHIKDIDPFNLKRAAGVGVRIMLPMIGLMGVDWGYGFDEINGSKKHGGSQFQFILGQEF